MGHLRYKSLPATRKWNDVVVLLGVGAELVDIASASYEAAKRGLVIASKDAGVNTVFSLLHDVIAASSSDDPPEALGRLGLEVSANPSFFEVLSAFNERVDLQLSTERKRNDATELAQRAASETLSYLFTQQSRSLFGSGAEKIREALSQYSTPRNYSILAREFFSRFVKRYLSYYLSRELSNHVGSSHAFKNVNEHKAFNEALDLHCRQTSKIIEDFASDWYSKTRFERGIDEESLKRFTYVALKKIGSELSRRGSTDVQA